MENNINYKELSFEQITLSRQEDTIFARARENGNEKVRHFHAFGAFGNGSGRVYTREGTAENWEILHGEDADQVRNAIKLAITNGEITVHKFMG